MNLPLHQKNAPETAKSHKRIHYKEEDMDKVKAKLI